MDGGGRGVAVDLMGFHPSKYPNLVLKPSGEKGLGSGGVGVKK